MLQLLGPSATLERAGSKVSAFAKSNLCSWVRNCLISRFGTVTSQEMRHLPAIALNLAFEEVITFNCCEIGSKSGFLSEIWACPSCI